MRHTALAAAVFLALARCSSPFLTEVHQIPPPNENQSGPCDVSAAPTELVSSAREDGVMLRWESGAGPEYSFVLDVQPAGTSTWSELARPEGVDREFLDTAAARDSSYRYRLRAVQSACNTPFSNEVEQATLPFAPNLACANQSSAAIRLSFTSVNQRATSLRLDRREVPRSFAELELLPHTSTDTYDDAALQPGLHYEYRVAALGAAGESISSVVDCWAPPRAPADLAVASSTVSSIVLGWMDTNDNEASYRVRREGSALGDVTSPSLQDSGLPAGATYDYEVYALGAWPEAVAQGFAAASLQGRTRLPPALTPLTATLDDTCVLTLQGKVAFDSAATPTPTFATSAATSSGAAWCSESLVGAEYGVTCATVEVAASANLGWSVTDTAGSVGSLTWPVTTALATRSPAMSGPVSWALAPMGGQQPLDGAQVPACGLACDSFRGSVAAANESACVLTASGNVSCWGRNAQGQLGDGNKGADRANPGYVCASGVGATCVPLASVTALSQGTTHVCALRGDGGVQCWGSGASGKLGDGTSTGTDAPRPESVCATGWGGSCVPLTGVQSVAAAATHTCAIVAGGAVRCWGSAEDGHLGDGVNAVVIVANPTPVCATGTGGTCTPLTGARALAAGLTHTCALLDGGAVSCWGDNVSGQLGDGTSGNVRLNPVAVCASGSGGTCTPLVGVVALAAGYGYTCAVMADGRVRCWGSNTDGQLGRGTTGQPGPNPGDVCASGSLTACVPFGGAVAIAASRWHACALVAGGRLTCWGGNAEGQLGDGSRINRLNPVAACASGTGASCVPFADARAVSARGDFTCALASSGGVACFGVNTYGQVGNGRLGAGERAVRPASVCASGSGSSCSGGASYSAARLATCTSLELQP